MDSDVPPGLEQHLTLLEEVLEEAEAQNGGRLLPERELAERLGCSRGQLRRLLTHLEHAGRITRHVGRGTFVIPREGSGAVHADDSEFAPAAIMTTSLLFEPEVAAMAALSATVEDIAELDHCLERARTLGGAWRDFESWDIAMHRAVAAATHNSEIVAMVDILNAARNTPSWVELKRCGVNHGTRAETLQDHVELVEGIRSRDRDRASSAMARHIGSVRRSVLRLEG